MSDQFGPQDFDDVGFEAFDPSVVIEEPAAAAQEPVSDGFTVAPDVDPTPEPSAPQAATGDAEEVEAEVEPAEFDPRHREAFSGLLFLGQATRTFEWLGHTFTLKSLTVGELMLVGVLHQRYQNTLGDIKAWQTAMCAAAVERVDGKPLPMPVENATPESVLRDRFDYIARSWFPPTVDKVYEEYLLLEAQVQATVDALGKASG